MHPVMALEFMSAPLFLIKNVLELFNLAFLFDKFPINFLKTLHNFFSWDSHTSESCLSFFSVYFLFYFCMLLFSWNVWFYFEPQITTNTFSDMTSYTWDELCRGCYHQQQGRSHSRFLPSSRVLAVSSLLGWPPLFLPFGMYWYYINVVTTFTYNQQQFYLNCTHLVPLFISSFVLFS
jgi:hypothetical protein